MECVCTEEFEGNLLAYLRHIVDRHQQHDGTLHQIYGQCDACIDEELLGHLPVICPAEHPVGRQNPLYEDGASTGWFTCEVCRVTYKPCLNKVEHCEVDGEAEVETRVGPVERYWHCEEQAVYIVKTEEGQERLCLNHLEESFT